MTFAGINPGNLINFDETNMCDDPRQEMVLVHKSIKCPEIIDTTKNSTSVMFAIASDGQLLALYVVYKVKHVYDVWIEGDPEGTAYNCQVPMINLIAPCLKTGSQKLH